MNYKLSLAALAVAGVVSGQALAALSPAENTALSALAPDSTWTTANWNTSLDGTDISGNSADWTAGTDECSWRGVVCDGPLGNITHIEIPNSAVGTTMDVALDALAPAAATLLVLNLSTTTTPANVMTGDTSDLANFTSLTHLALNGSSIAGAIPDMTAAANLNWVNIADNPNITGLGAKLAGGSAVTLIGVNNNTSMAADLTATLDGRDPGTALSFTANDSMAFGSVAFVAGDNFTVANSDMVVTNDDGNSGYTAANVVQPVASADITGTAGEESATINWIAPATGAQTGYSVSLTADGGATLVGTTAIANAATVTHSFSGVTAGTYKASVQSTGPSGRVSSAILSDQDFVVTAGVATLVCTAPQVLNEAETACVDPEEEEEEETTTKKSGGGAALWLIMLPLMGLLRRKRA